MPFSQLQMVCGFKSSVSATSRCLNRRICLSRLMCSPMVCGFSKISLGRITLRFVSTYGSNPKPNCAKATQGCRCGHLGDAALACSRAPRCAADYQGKISGPLLDRIDLHVDVEAVSAGDLTLPPPAEGSSDVAARVQRARAVQSARYADEKVRTNCEADGELLDSVATPDDAGRTLLAQAAEAMRLTARGYSRSARRADDCGSCGKRGRGARAYC